MPMWTPDELLELAERCEAGPNAGSRDIDCDVQHAMHGPSCANPLGYSYSMDAAAKLVPPGLSFEVRSSGTGDRGQATVWDPMRAPGNREWRVTGCANPALALCAAGIRARAAIAIETQRAATGNTDAVAKR